MRGGISVEKCSKNRGFTLAELLIVVAIIGILVAISIPIFTAQLEKAREATDLANIRSAYATAAANAMSPDKTEVKIDTGNVMQSDGPIDKITSDYCGPWKSSEIKITKGAQATVYGVLGEDGKWVWRLLGGAEADPVTVGS